MVPETRLVEGQMTEIPYEQLIFLLGHLSVVCSEFWPADGTFYPWAAIFIADWVRGIASDAQLMEMLPIVKSDYMDLAKCIVATK